jgi:hypothetical protein
MEQSLSENPVITENFMLVEHCPKDGMQHSQYGCHTTLYAFGGLVVLFLFVQIVLQVKTIKLLRKAVKR